MTLKGWRVVKPQHNQQSMYQFAWNAGFLVYVQNSVYDYNKIELI